MARTIVIILFLLTVQAANAETAKNYFPQYSGFNDEGMKLLDGFDIKTGTIQLEHGAKLSLPDDFYFLDRDDAIAVLTTFWGNPVDTTTDTLGMIFPKKYTPLDQVSWGLEVTFDAMGYIDDQDAMTLDYEALLADMKQGILEANTERAQQGFDSITLIGWAAQPQYDLKNKRLHWAKELQFGTSVDHTLNYDVRILSRKGVLVMRYIASMAQLPEIQSSIDSVLNMVSFNEGERYSDFDANVDTVAAVGLGGLIAGKVAAKAGLLAVALVILKKFGILIIAPIIWLFGKFRRKPDNEPPAQS